MALLEVSGEDAKRVTVVSTFALAVVAFLLKESDIEGQKDWVKYVAVLGLIFLATGAGLFWAYASQVNYSRMTIARCLVDSDSKRSWDRWAGESSGVKARYGRIYRACAICIALGLLFSATAITQSIVRF